MGLVDDTDTSEVENAAAVSELDVEEAGVDGNKEFLFSPNNKRKRSYPTDPRTPTTRNNDLLAITCIRRKGITESEEIWEELEDGSLGELSPFGNRRYSTMSTPAKDTARARIDDAPNESSPLLERSSTSRSYRDKRPRRPAPAGEARRKRPESQEAIGSWWPLKWWKGRNVKGKDAMNGGANENGNGGAA